MSNGKRVLQGNSRRIRMTRYEDIDTDEANLLLFFIYFELIRYESANRLAHKRATGF